MNVLYSLAGSNVLTLATLTRKFSRYSILQALVLGAVLMACTISHVLHIITHFSYFHENNYFFFLSMMWDTYVQS